MPLVQAVAQGCGMGGGCVLIHESPGFGIGGCGECVSLAQAVGRGIA